MNADTFNSLHPVGTPVFAYPGFRPEDHRHAQRLVTRTRSAASVLGGHTEVVWVDGHSACIALDHVDVVSEAEWQVAREADAVAAVAPKQTLGHATLAESVPALLATITQLRDLRAPLIDALRTVHESMTSCVGDEWAMEWLGEVWTQLPLAVRALAGDQDATAEIAAEQGALPMPVGERRPNSQVTEWGVRRVDGGHTTPHRSREDAEGNLRGLEAHGEAAELVTRAVTYSPWEATS